MNNRVAIIGMPRSGTTVTTKIFHNIDGCVGFSEPIRAMRQARTNAGGYDLDTIDPDKFLEQLKDIDKNVFVKETFSNVISPTNKDVLKILSLDKVIFVFREPKALYSAWREMKQMPNGMVKERYKFNVGQFNNMYLDFIKLYRTVSKVRPTSIIWYEDICDAFPKFTNDERATDVYLHNAIKNLGIKFNSMKFRDLDDPIISIGDHKSEGTVLVRHPRTSFDNLDNFEIDIINNMISKKYESLKDKIHDCYLSISTCSAKLMAIKIMKRNVPTYGLKELKKLIDGERKEITFKMNIAQMKQFEEELNGEDGLEYDFNCVQLYREEQLKQLL